MPVPIYAAPCPYPDCEATLRLPAGSTCITVTAGTRSPCKCRNITVEIGWDYLPCGRGLPPVLMLTRVEKV